MVQDSHRKQGEAKIYEKPFNVNRRPSKRTILFMAKRFAMEDDPVNAFELIKLIFPKVRVGSIDKHEILAIIYISLKREGYQLRKNGHEQVL